MKVRGMKERLIVGVQWEGTFEEAGKGKLREMIEEVKSRMTEIKGKINETEFIGVSFHDRRGGFTQYAGWEVEQGEEVPAGMARCVLPEGKYAIYKHDKNNQIKDTYTELVQIIEDKGLTPLKPEEVDLYDDLPIKIELYSLDKLLDEELECEIHIPVIK
ncbi:hypothetical protein CR194_17690 [Salipaludibacillus keqinensis]|uniref:AraC effector-binding domain-containing protein n=1 Tax=Salipaludibacillus keqinensis TaxID=2045207 RepID=A0A323TDV8_9BACI|nr:effector binding domain-containing protein [Salipaludibacillus keqinensis]PYZ92027.1 hypothetical protein CR194_17690 [Salipaludibacillus keqinensis]